MDHPIPVGQAVLQKVVARLGGAAIAASSLGIPDRILVHFLEGKMAVPDGILLRALDVVLADPQRDSVPEQALRSIK